MYKAMSGGEGEWRDGVFSHASPQQSYEASASQYADGSLGAVRLRAQGARRRGRHGMSGAFQDGSLGRTFLPAFTGPQMRGLGYVFRDGVLGDDVTVSLPGVSTSQPKPKWSPDLASIGLGVMAGALLFYVVKL